MKRTIIFSFLVTLISITAFSQANGLNNRYEVMDPATSGKIFHNPVYEASKPKGSQYLNQMFASAKVDNVEQNSFMRYNVFKDEFEFISTKNDTLILDKIADFANITFVATKTKYKYVNYTNNNGKPTNGYLIALYEKGDFILFKKQNITFYEEKIAKTSLETNMPAKYVKADDFYYLKNKEAGIIEFPSNKKGLVKLYPERKAAIEAFIKANDIDFDLEKDMKKIIDFLAS